MRRARSDVLSGSVVTAVADQAPAPTPTQDNDVPLGATHPGARVVTRLQPRYAGLASTSSDAPARVRRDNASGRVFERTQIHSGTFAGLRATFVEHDDGRIGFYADVELRLLLAAPSNE